MRIQTKIALAFVMLLAAASPSFGQHYIAPTVVNSLGQPVPNAQIRVCTEPAVGFPCTPLATIYTCIAQDGTCPAANPLTGDANGNFDFYGSTANVYHFEISGPSLVPFIEPYVYMPGAGSGGSFLISINGDTTQAQTLIGAGGITITDDGGGQHTITGSSGNLGGSGTPPHLPIWLTATTLGDSTEQDLNNTFQSSATQGFSATQGVFANGGVGPQILDFGVPNGSSPGTVRYYLAKIVSGVANTASTSDTAPTLYPVADTVLSNGVALCAPGTIGNACLQVMPGGQAILTADAGGIAVNHYFGESTSVSGAIMDLGATPNLPGCLGVADSSAITASTAGTVRMGSCGAVSPGGGACNIGPYLAIPYYSTNPTGTACSPSDEIFAGIDPNGTAGQINMLGIGTTAPAATLEVDGQHPADQSGDGTPATNVLAVQGAKGGNTTGSTGQTAGKGSDVNIFAGDAGDAPAGSTNGNGGNVTINAGTLGTGTGVITIAQPGFLWLQQEFTEPSPVVRGPVLVGLGDCVGLYSTDDYPVNFCIHNVRAPLDVSGNGTPAHDALVVLGEPGGTTTGVTGQTAGKGGGIQLVAGVGGEASTGSNGGDGGDIVIDSGLPGNGDTSGNPGTLKLNPGGGTIEVNNTPTITYSGGGTCVITAITNGLITGATCTP